MTPRQRRQSNRAKPGRANQGRANTARPPAKAPASRPTGRARREQARLRRQRQRLWWGLAGVAAVILLAVGLTLSAGGSRSSGSSSSTAVSGPTLAPVSPSINGQTIDAIQCQTAEQVLFHIHAHLAIFVNGQPRVIPLGIGIPGAVVENTASGGFVGAGTCFYWLHAHTADGIIHIESPVARTYTLGNYFDIWGQPLSATQVGPAQGAVTAYLNGQRFSGDPRSIPLTAHALVQLNVGTDVTPKPFTFPAGL